MVASIEIDILEIWVHTETRIGNDVSFWSWFLDHTNLLSGDLGPHGDYVSEMMSPSGPDFLTIQTSCQEIWVHTETTYRKWCLLLVLISGPYKPPVRKFESTRRLRIGNDVSFWSWFLDHTKLLSGDLELDQKNLLCQEIWSYIKIKRTKWI